MKITEIHANGETTNISLDFVRTADRQAIVLHPVQEEPIAVFLVKSGWNHGYPTYHVIIEYGDMENSDYEFMSLDRVCNRFGITADQLIGAKHENNA